ncbi:Nucleolar protein, partial [Reticulomyxa filosa]
VGQNWPKKLDYADKTLQKKKEEADEDGEDDDDEEAEDKEDQEEEDEETAKKKIPQVEDWASQFEQTSDSVVKASGASKIFAFGRRMSQELKKMMKKKEIDLDQLLAINRSKRPVLQHNFPGSYVGGLSLCCAVEQKALDVVVQRLQTTDQIENEVRSSLQRLDSSTLKTREEIEKTFDELIEMLKKRKKEALEQCDEFADKTRKELVETAIQADNIRNLLLQAHNTGKQMLHVQNIQSEGYPARVRFQEYMMKILADTTLNVNTYALFFLLLFFFYFYFFKNILIITNHIIIIIIIIIVTIPSVEMDVFWDKESLEWIRGVLANVQTNTIDKTKYLDDKTYGVSPSPQPPPSAQTQAPTQQNIYLPQYMQPQQQASPNVIVVNPNGTTQQLPQQQFPEWWNLIMSASNNQLLSPKHPPTVLSMG